MTMKEDKKPSLRDVLSNLSIPMRPSTKVFLLFRNNLTKILHRKTCCGHQGEPGC
jgi:hypothetical protein